MSGVPSTSDVVAAEITQDAAARDNRTACKRKLQRIEGAIEVLKELVSPEEAESRDLTKKLLQAEEQATSADEELAELLARTDGGEAMRKHRTAWFEAAGAAASEPKRQQKNDRGEEEDGGPAE